MLPQVGKTPARTHMLSSRPADVPAPMFTHSVPSCPGSLSQSLVLLQLSPTMDDPLKGGHQRRADTISMWDPMSTWLCVSTCPNLYVWESLMSDSLYVHVSCKTERCFFVTLQTFLCMSVCISGRT